MSLTAKLYKKPRVRVKPGFHFFRGKWMFQEETGAIRNATPNEAAYCEKMCEARAVKTKTLGIVTGKQIGRAHV